MEESQDTLKVAHSVVSKELARFRPCDIETRCYFCREWAQFVQKKHFSWSTRNQTDTKPTKQQQQQQQQQQQRDNAHVFTAGRYKIKLGSSVNDKIKYKSNARELFVDFKSMLKNSVDEINSLKTEKLIQVSEQWIAEPTQLVTLPSLFEPVEFNPYDAAAKIQDDPGAPAKILEPLVIDRQNILFPISRFQLLRNLTPDVLQNFSEPTCDHTRPEFKTPSELDIERDIYNENLQRELKTATAELERALDEAYSRLSNFITQAKALEKERCSLMGPECQKSIDYFAAKQNIKPFPEYWASLGDLKKQKVPAETIDGYFNGYFDQLIDHVKVFQTDFAEPQLNAACELMEKTWNIVASSVRQVFERKDTVKPGDKEYAERCGAYLTYIGKYNPVELVRVNIENARKDLDFRIKEYLPEITEVMRMYRVESKQTTVGRVEKVAKASFKKLIKKATSGYDSIRHHFRYLMTQKVLSEIRFCACLVIGMEVLMLEAEEVEVNVIHREINRFLDTHKEMAAAQAHLYKMFEEGISTGRTELAGVIGRLVLKETMRVQGDSIAKQRQSNLLESLGLPVEGEGEMSKKKRARKKKAEPEPEPVPVPESEPEHELRNGSLKKRLTKKATTPVIEAAKTATPSTKEVLAAAESETIDSLSEARADAPGAQQSFEEHSKQETIDTPLSAKVDTTSSAERDPVEHIHVASKDITDPSLKEPKISSTSLATGPLAAVSDSDKWETVGKSNSTKKNKGDSKPNKAADEVENTPVNTGARRRGTRSPTTEERLNATKEDAIEEKRKETSVLNPVEKTPKSDNNKPPSQSETKNEQNVAVYASVASKANESNTSKESGWGEIGEDNPWNSITSDAKTGQDWNSPSTGGQKDIPVAVQQAPPGFGTPTSEPQPSANGWQASDADNIHKDEGWGVTAENTQSNDGWGSAPDAAQNIGGWGMSAKTAENSSGWGAPSADNAHKSEGWNTSAKKVQSNKGWNATFDTTENVGGWGNSSKSSQEVGGWGNETPSNKQDNGDTWNKASVDARVVRSEVNMDGGWRNTSQKKQHYKSWKEGGDRSANGSSDWSGSGAQWGAYSNDDGSTEWKQSYKRSTGRKQNGWLGKNETAGNIASEDNQGTGSSHGWDTEKKPANVSVGQTLQQHQQQELQQPQQYEQDEVKTVSISLNSITQQQLPPTQPPGLNVTNTLTSSYTNTQPTMLQQQQPIFQLLSVDEIRSMSVELIAGVIQNLQQDYNRLYREMELMKITLACQQQQNQLDQARNQTEKEGYIQLIQTLRNSNEGLQNKLASLQQQQQQQTMSYDGAGNAINGGTTAGFGGQDLFSTLRQEITSSQPRQHHHYRRGGKRHFYDKHVNARCSNCGDLGHSSSECTDACRYCNSTDHLSEACHQSQ